MEHYSCIKMYISMNAKKMLFAGACLLAACFTQAQKSQMPKAFSYQAVVRDNAGKVVANKEVGVKIEILKGSAESGTVVYEETLRPKSTLTGTVNMMIGNGNAAQFAAIDWGGNAHFLRISLSLDGSDNYKVVSTTQMLPVPYALYAEKAGSVVNNGGSTPETPSAERANFLLMPMDDGDYPTDFMTALKGGTVEILVITKTDGNGNIVGYSTPYETFDFLFYIMYLNGVDLQLSAEVKGFRLNEEKSSESTEYGRICSFILEDVNALGIFDSEMIIKDNSGNVLKKYPFKVKTYIRE